MSTIDQSGMLLEGIRVATGNNQFGFPPRNYVLDDNNATFQATTSRAEYCILVDSLVNTDHDIEIGDPNLRFVWTRNEPGCTRFDWDGFARRWLPSPGSSPDSIGIISNDPRLVAAIPDPAVTSAPFSFYVGNPVRLITFDVTVVDSEADFTDPNSLAHGSLEIARDTGSLNFSSADLALYEAQIVFGQRQNFFDRTKKKGDIGVLPLSSAISYFLFLNPLPASGQFPRVKIGYGDYLNAVEVANEAALGSPLPGNFHWSRDTGRVKFADADVDANQEETVYYDGVILSSFQLQRTDVGPLTSIFPSPMFTIPGLVGLETDQTGRYVVFAELAGQPRNYFPMTLFDSTDGFPSNGPSGGTTLGDVVTGAVYFSDDDLFDFLGWNISYVHAAATVERGVTFLACRSGVNGSGEETEKDFRIRYSVEDQVIQDGIIGAPFIMLPTVPLVDSTLHFSIASAPGSSGTFVGELKDGTDPDKQGFGYLLDLPVHQLKFCFRKTVEKTLLKATPAIKLDDGAVSSKGFEVTLNGDAITPGIDFDFDPDTGLLEFLEPIGEDDPNNILAITGTVSLPNQFIANKDVFLISHAGKSLYIAAGNNAGIYEILSVPNAKTVIVSPDFASSGPDSADVRMDQEVIADRIWTEFKPGYKKFALFRASSPAGPYTKMDESEYSVQASVGQINLTEPAKPGESFRAEYIFLSSSDGGLNSTPIPKVEKAIFKIRQETGVGSVGSKIVTFNPDGDIVSTDRDIQVAINGFTQDASSFTFTPPGTLQLAQPLKADQTVIIDYWVQNAPGGNQSFNLLFAPIDLDPAKITKGATSATFNRNQTDKLSPGSAFLVGDTNITILDTVIYDASNDVTQVTFEQPALADSGNGGFLASEPITGRYRVQESVPADVFTKGTNSITFSGVQPYKAGMVFTVNQDPYYAIAVKTDEDANTTKVTFASPAVRNYIVPSITRTIRPVLKTDGKFTTNKPANLNFPITLIRMGRDRAVLVKDVDYSIAEGGVIQLNTNAVFGDSFHAMYVSRKAKPAGSVFKLNYAHAISPSSSNGIESQRLVASYTLYAPDSFFFRVESFSTFLPEVQDLLRSSAQSGGTSGPDTSSRSSLKAKDFGNPSLFFPEQHYENVDLVIRRLLKYYNDLVNRYEDLLANFDGRVVGGTDGRFKFDGITDNPPRSTLFEVTNDLDDQIKLFDFFGLVDFFDFELIPFYGYMGGVNRFSRFFRTIVVSTVALNGQVSNDHFGEALGSLQVDGSPISNIRFSFGLISALSNSKFTTAAGGDVVTIEQNGDAEPLLPPFEVGMAVQLYRDDGFPDVFAHVTAVSGFGPFDITIDTPTTLTSGSILHSTLDPMDTTVHFYVNGRDLIIDFDSGQVNNFTLPDPLSDIQNVPVGNEVVEGLLFYVPQNTKALRIPVLDGKESLDDGRVSRPLLSHKSEIGLLTREANLLTNLGSARVGPTLTGIQGATIFLSVGDTIRFVDGPNAGLDRVISTIVGPGAATVSAPFQALDPAGSAIVKAASDGTVLTDVLTDELGVLNDNTSTPAVFPSLVGTLDSSLTLSDTIIRSWGPQRHSGTGTAAGTVLTDASANFTDVDTKNDVLYVPSGANRGVYKVSSTTATTLTVSTSSPYFAFPAGGSTPYVIIKKYSFLTKKGPKFMAEFLQKTLAFYASTQAWAAAPDPLGIVTRQEAISDRLTDLDSFVKSVQAILANGDKLYDTRYLWINQRIDRKTGTLTALKQSQSQRQEDEQKLLEDQEKLLIAQALG